MAVPSLALGSKLVIEYRATSKLTCDPGNPRTHSKQQLRQIAKSIETFGFNVPILIDEALTVIAGHGRLAAAALTGLEEVPTISLEHLSEAQRRAFMVADNRLTENSSWDSRLLGDQLRFLSEADLDFSLEVTGFEMSEIDLFIEGLETPEVASDVAEIISEATSRVSQPGDLWLLGKHRVLCGNSLELASYKPLMEGKTAAVVIADPPYNVRIEGHASGLGRTKHRDFQMACGEMDEQQFTDFLSTAMQAACASSLDASVAYWFIDWRHVGEMTAAGRRAYDKLLNICVWAKDRPGMGSFYRSAHELIFVYRKGTGSHRNNVELGRFGRSRSNIWQYPSASSLSRSAGGENLLQMHPTAKPIALVADAIRDCSARGDIVLDPFLGSGTSVLAAEKTGRICYGLELDPQYVDLAIRRWQRLTGGTATHALSRRTFVDLEASHGA